MYLSTCISGGYYVIFESGFPSDVYSTWGFSRGSLVYISMRITRTLTTQYLSYMDFSVRLGLIL